MSENPVSRVKWSHVVVAGLFLLVGVDIGMRVASRGNAPAEARPASAPPAAPKPPPTVAKSESAKQDSKQADEKKPQNKPAEAPTTREVGPALPPPSGKVAELIKAAEEANAKGDKPGAIAKLKEAAAAADEPARKEELTLRALWIHYEIGEMAEVKRIAEAMMAHPVREENQRVAEEVLAKLASKGK
ncbi:MAG: hypothetical protein QM820_59785 [Minicystis sp.]